MKFFLIACTATLSLLGHEVEIVRDYLRPRAVEWRSTVRESYPNGSAKIVYFYEDRPDGSEVAVKRVLLSETGAIAVEEDLEGELQHGLSVLLYPNGKVREIVCFAGGVKHGPHRHFYEDGRLRGDELFDEGELYGKKVLYYEDGQIEFECSMEGGKVEGEAVFYYPSGKQKRKVVYKNGLKEGLAYDWYENGAVSLQANYLAGKENDEGDLAALVAYYDDGSLRSVKHFALGVPLGTHATYHRNGDLLGETLYDDQGVSVKPIKEFSNSGELIAEYGRKGEKLHGRLRRWTDNGVLQIDCTYQEGALDGEYVERYPNKQMKLKKTFRKGQPDGVHQAWHENGKEKERIGYRLGVLSGVHKQWNERGELLLEETYERGNPKGQITSFYGKNKPKSVIRVSDGKRHGKALEYYENGRLKLQMSYQENKPEGLAEGWYEDGSLAFTRRYKEGRFVGEQREFFQGPGKALHTLYVYNSKGELHGEQKTFYPSGRLASSTTCDDGLLQGKKVAYGENGDVIEEAFYQKGKLHGSFMQRDKSGRETIYTYVNNIKEGPYAVYYPQSPKYGKVKAIEATCKEGATDGIATEYNQAGVKVARVTYIKGKKEGECTIFNTGGTISKIIPYCNDKIHGEEKSFYPSGKLSSLVTYNEGQLDGPSLYWNERSVLTCEADYVAGKRDGRFNKYADDGTPRLLQTYKDDNVVFKETLQ